MRLLALAFSLFFAAGLGAQELGPEELVKKVTTDVLDAIKSDKQLQAGDRRKALALAEQKIMPHVDFQQAAQLATGKAWQTATPEQQAKIVNEVRTMLVRIYSNSINTYRGQTMKVMPLRLAPGATEVTVRNQYMRQGQSPVPVEYAMRKGADGWKIYDISVEGVSLVLTYRAEFENITSTSGVDGLLKRLAERNA